jgi:cytochrome c556
MNRSVLFTVLLSLSVLIFAGCGSSSDSGGPTGKTTNASVESTTGSAEAAKPSDRPDTLPLLTIMVNLEGQMQSISSGLWRHNFDQIASAADRIANHAKIPKKQVKTIRGILGEKQFKKFVRDDKTVHNMAVKLTEAASEQDFARTADIYQKLEQGCISCHQNHRTEIRDDPSW